MALEEDQVRVEVLSIRAEVGSADKLTVGAGIVGVGGVLQPPPPPPPPQETINKTLKVNVNNFFKCKTLFKKNICLLN